MCDSKMIFFESNLIAFFHPAKDIAPGFFSFSSLSKPAQSLHQKINCLCIYIRKSLQSILKKKQLLCECIDNTVS